MSQNSFLWTWFRQIKLFAAGALLNDTLRFSTKTGVKYVVLRNRANIGLIRSHHVKFSQEKSVTIEQLKISYSDNMAVKETMIFLLAIMYPVVMIAKQPANPEGKY